ncbi:sulfite exporter TauE/SafE family protein [Flavobacterium agricola]|uniref:Sulfite exporter TauE/SafE family protein n=1 Tax=Flavobacterium agricola TaxID=2870839 RepID=A0ABY6M3I4_9FLAO|nr:sulfite exporter TauE/SafE family protein [Flavobacterium agricola]UYW02415.1 sulfite exporter TauE/SafE family protein [Flavobacterium agricola]
MIIGAFLLGLISSLHCVGMCGPIALMLPVNRSSQLKKFTQIALYNIGRITTYTFLGVVFGLFGKGLFLAGAQQNLSIVLGILMILVAVISEKSFAQINFSKPINRFFSQIKSKLGKQFKNKSNGSIFLIGILNGFLPCALVYVALFGAISLQNVSLGATYMFCYGLGTVPLMSLVVLFSVNIQKLTRGKWQKAIPIFIILLGALFIIRGLGLSIPFVSPSIMNLMIGADVHC